MNRPNVYQYGVLENKCFPLILNAYSSSTVYHGMFFVDLRYCTINIIE